MTVTAETLATIDLTDNDRYAEAVPYADFDLLRREDPVHWHPERDGPGFWAVTRHDDVVAVSRDTAVYSSQFGATALEDLAPDALAARRSMIDTDPPEHTRLRRLLTADFTRRQVAGYGDRVRDTVRAVLDTALPHTTFDLVERVATAIPIRVLCQILGVPQDDEALLIELGDRMIANTDPDLAEVLLDSPASDAYRLLPFRSPAALDMHAYSRRLHDRRRVAPRGDLVSRLATAGLTGQEEDAMFLLLIVAGNETTRSALSLGVQAFLEHPGEWERLRERPDLLDSAVEEVLRWTTPLHHFRRTATRDAVLRGRRIRAGDKVVVWYTSANRDEAVFKDPYAFDVGRYPNPQIAFGRGGPHRCLGEHLARLEIRTVLAELLRRGVRLEAAGPAARIRSNFTNGLKRLPVRVVA
ncbi:cytochrome P450 [Actinomadura macrotermitis]|uniref:Methyl-branched lipid omega-hydroxylase n=1 Tax=Actinomadura macrotermitis TaxID=2585200 RepID=A0A7K0BND9_9ACTN|nr:cytochrome P450 [Actinomadura macrotermitis]MQY02691.1 Methyl-branched lipid omega-hydroxylase [Actinomadura macrotermitis]